MQRDSPHSAGSAGDVLRVDPALRGSTPPPRQGVRTGARNGVPRQPRRPGQWAPSASPPPQRVGTPPPPLQASSFTWPVTAPPVSPTPNGADSRYGNGNGGGGGAAAVAMLEAEFTSYSERVVVAGAEVRTSAVSVGVRASATQGIEGGVSSLPFVQVWLGG